MVEEMTINGVTYKLGDTVTGCTLFGARETGKIVELDDAPYTSSNMRIKTAALESWLSNDEPITLIERVEDTKQEPKFKVGDIVIRIPDGSFSDGRKRRIDTIDGNKYITTRLLSECDYEEVSGLPWDIEDIDKYYELYSESEALETPFIYDLLIETKATLNELYPQLREIEEEIKKLHEKRLTLLTRIDNIITEVKEETNKYLEDGNNE